MLSTYLSATQALLQNPPANPPLYSTALLTTAINSARGQLAGEAECIRFMGSLTSSIGSRVYPFTSIALTGAVGIQGVINVRSVWYQVGQGQVLLRPRPFEWFSLYQLNTPVPPSGPPKVWAQYGQGAEAQTVPNPIGGGSIYVSPLPDIAYVMPVDCVCYPIPLADDTTAEAIPYLWTDAVPYYAAYLALLSSQTGARMQQAQEYFKIYTDFVNRARRAATPSLLPTIYPQQPSPVRANQLGSSGKAA